MKIKKYLFTLIIIIFMLYTNYDDIKDVFTKTDTNIPSMNSSNSEALKGIPIVSYDSPLNERFLIEKALTEQRKLYKPGFITNEFQLDKAYVAYYPFNDTSGYSTTYRTLANPTTFHFEASSSLDYTMYESIKENLTASKNIQHDTLNLLYGKHMNFDNDFYILGNDETENIVYLMHIGSEQEGYTDEAVKKIGQSLQTEQEGAYDLLYNNFSLDIEKLKFPMLHDQRVTVHEASISMDKFKDNTGVQVSYMLSEQDFIIYQIEEKPTVIDDNYKVVGDFTTSTDVEITEYAKEDNSDYRVFHWIEKPHAYTMSFSLKNPDVIDTNEMKEIIESAVKDKRSFENKDAFQPLNKEATLNKSDKKLNSLFKQMND